MREADLSRLFVPPLAIGDRVELNDGGYARVVEIVSETRIRVKDGDGKERCLCAWHMYYCPEPQVIANGLERIQRSWHNAWLRNKLGLSPMHGGRARVG